MKSHFDDIYFYEQDHRYVSRKHPEKRFKSVTQLIGEYIPEFRNAYWLVYKTLEANGYDVFSDARAHVPTDHILCNGELKHYKDFGVDTRKLSAEWERLKREGQERGSYLHSYLEALAHRKFIPKRKDYAWQIEQAETYWFSEKPKVIATELVVGSLDVGIMGMVDRLDVGDKLVDYKTDKEIKMENPWESFTGPLSVLEACNFNKYCVQMNLYAWIIERETKTPIREMEIVHFPPNQDELFCYRKYKVPNMQELIGQWVDWMNKDQCDVNDKGKYLYAAK